MLKGSTVVDLANAIVPLYVCIGLGYVSSKLRILPYEQNFAGIGGFAGKFAVPFLVFRMVATTNPYHLNMKLVEADILSKFAILLVLCLNCFYRPTHQYMAWVSSIFNMATMPNSVLIGIPLLTALYPGTDKYVTTLVMVQIVLWFNVCILLLEIHKTVYENSTHMDVHLNSTFELEFDTSKELDFLEIQSRKSVETDVKSRGSGSGLELMEIEIRKAVDADEKSRGSGSGLELVEIEIRKSMEAKEANITGLGQDICNTSKRIRDQQGAFSTIEDPPKSGLYPNAGTGFVIHIKCDPEPGVVEGKQTNYAEETIAKVGATKRKLGISVSMEIAMRVLHKFVLAPTVWASLLGLTYSLINFKFNDGKTFPVSLKSTIDLVANCTLGLCMFMLGMNMYASKKLLACGLPKAVLAVGVRFVLAPAVMAVASFVVGLRGDMFRFAVLQAMVPQAVLSFVWASQYNVHVDIFSTAVWLQTLIFFPFAIALNMLLSVGS